MIKKITWVGKVFVEVPGEPESVLRLDAVEDRDLALKEAEQLFENIQFAVSFGVERGLCSAGPKPWAKFGRNLGENQDINKPC